MALEQKPRIALVMRLCRSLTLPQAIPGEAARARLLTPAIKFWVCKRAPAFVYEAMECLGGNGYVEESLLPRLYREAPVNAIWEGSGNVMALDVLARGRHQSVCSRCSMRSLTMQRGCRACVRRASRSGRRLQRARRRRGSRSKRLALLAAAAALRVSAPAAVAELFARTAACWPARRDAGYE